MTAVTLILMFGILYFTGDFVMGKIDRFIEDGHYRGDLPPDKK